MSPKPKQELTELTEVKEKFNKVVILARKFKANLITAETQLKSVNEENLVLMGQVTRLTKDTEALKTEIGLHHSNSLRVIKIMKDPSQDMHQVAIRVANILNPVTN